MVKSITYISMVKSGNFQELFDASTKFSHVTLPPYKQIFLKIDYGSTNSSEIVYEGQKPALPFAQSDIFLAKIIKSRRLTAVSVECKAVYEITFDARGSNFKHKPGDTIGIIPTNSVSDIDFIIDHLDLNLKANLTYNLTVDKTQKGNKLPAYIPVQSTLRYVLTNCVDVRGSLKKLFILALSRYTKDETERKILEFLCSKEGSMSYSTHVLNTNMCIIDIFTLFKTCQPPIEVLLAHLPRLLPRPYSIANSYLKNPNVIKICFSILDTDKRKGLVTGWLENLILKKNVCIEKQLESLNICYEESDIKIPIYLRSNITGFCLPENDETSMILIGPGAGVAPFMGFLEEREVQRKLCEKSKFGKIWLFFGCRNPELDFVYEKEMKHYLTNGTLDNLVTAFSRVKNEVKYVQDAVQRHGEEITKLLKNGANVFVCGDLKIMETQIKEILMKCLVDYQDMSAEESIQFIKDLQKNKRYLTDVWS